MEKSFAQATDNELVEKSKSNPDAFGELVARYQGRLFHYVRRISYFGSEDIEDIIQEVFLKTYRSLNLFDGDLKFSTWIYQITRNATIDAIRKKQTRPQTVFMEDEDMIRIFKSNTDISSELHFKEHLKKIKNIIDSLPYKYKEVLILRFLEDKSYEEIMDIVQKPKGTVAALINRGRKMIVEKSRENFLLN